MSAVPLTGAWLEIAVVTDYDTASESETLLGFTTEDIEIERDPEEIEWSEHSNPNTQRREGFETATMTFNMIVVDDVSNFQDAEVIDANGAFQRNVTHEAVYIHLYERPSDTTPAQTYYAEEVQFVIQNVSFPMDGPGQGELEGWIGGNHGFDLA